MAQTPHSFLPWPDLQLQEQRSMSANLEAIAREMAWLEETGEREQWPPKTLFALTLCADEALTNIVTHARSGGSGLLQIQVLLCSSESGVALCIADDGAEFDPTARATEALAKTLDEAEIGGHGLRLMRHYLQRFEYRRSQGWNWLLLSV